MADRREPAKQHILPQPGPPIDAQQRPFVGNKAVLDNLCERAQVAVWNALGKAGGYVTLRPTGDCVGVGGHVDSREDRDTVLRAVATAVAPVHVIDDLAVRAPAPAHHERRHVPGVPILRVRRFCSLTEPSLAAGIDSAVLRLSDALEAAGIPVPATLMVIYRNRGASTVTVDVGAVVPPSTALPGPDHDVATDTMPGGPSLSISTSAGLAGLVSAQAALLGEAHGTEHDAVWWQALEARHFRPWRGLPAGELHLALGSLPVEHPLTSTAG